MEEDNPTAEVVFGNQVSSNNFFKSSFARSFVVNYRDTKSYDTKFFDYISIDDGNVSSMENVSVNSKNNKYLSPIDVEGLSKSCENNINSMKKKEPSLNDTTDQQELNDLRKQYQALAEENGRLNRALRMHQASNTQAIDNVLLQTQIDTLQWQLKQTEANRQMYHSLMKQVVHFLERARKSLNILHITKNINKNATRNSRNQSACMEESLKDQSSPISPQSTSRFTRSESVTQISPDRSCSDIRHFTWSMNSDNFGHRTAPSEVNFEGLSQEYVKTKDECVSHKCTTDCTEMKVTSDIVPPGKLSQEAFRLLKIIESLLAMRESHLSVVSSSFSSATSSSTVSSNSPSSLSSSVSPTSLFITSSTAAIAINNDSRFNSAIECNVSHQDEAIINLSRLHQDDSHHECCDFSINSIDIDNLSNFNKIPSTEHILIDSSNSSASSRNSNSSDNISSSMGYPRYSIASNFENLNTNTEEVTKNNGRVIRSALKQRLCLVPSSTPINPKVKITKLMENEEPNIADKSVTSMSNAEDESEFYTRNSFHDVGLPTPTSHSIMSNGCHSQIGLPEISLDRINHRRWSSTPAEIQNLFKKYKNGFLPHRSNVESLSVWV